MDTEIQLTQKSKIPLERRVLIMGLWLFGAMQVWHLLLAINKKQEVVTSW
jgi:hypothetical protein